SLRQRGRGRERRIDQPDDLRHHHVVIVRVLIDSDLGVFPGRQILNLVEDSIEDVAVARLDLRAPWTAVGPRALAGARGCTARALTRPLERGQIAAAGDERSPAIERVRLYTGERVNQLML